jgi:YNFM family putative membrane transporter
MFHAVFVAPILGGLIGSAVLGQLFDRLGWLACVTGIALALIVAALLAVRLKMPSPMGIT